MRVESRSAEHALTKEARVAQCRYRAPRQIQFPTCTISFCRLAKIRVKRSSLNLIFPACKESRHLTGWCRVKKGSVPWFMLKFLVSRSNEPILSPVIEGWETQSHLRKMLPFFWHGRSALLITCCYCIWLTSAFMPIELLVL